jgi:hypothetical protein
MSSEEFAAYTKENTVDDPDEEDAEDGTHRNYDKYSSELPQNSHFLAAFKNVPGCKKRNPHRLGVSRIPFIECTMLSCIIARYLLKPTRA